MYSISHFFLLQRLAESEVNCDSIKVYRVQYQQEGAGDWETVLASLNTDIKNITGLQFSKEYFVQVVAVNNQDYTGFSTLFKVVTPDSSGANTPWSKHYLCILCCCNPGVLCGPVFDLYCFASNSHIAY